MSFIRQLIERKISSITGGAVMMDEFKFSPLSGSIEGVNVRMAAERFVPPFLSIDRIQAKIGVARALRGEIVLNSLTIERPVFICNIHSDGKTNLARKPNRPAEAIVPKEGSAGGMWELNPDKIAINHGRIEFRDATRDNYKLAIEGINATATPDGNDIALTLTADGVGRRDKPVELGMLKMLGKLSGGGFKEPLASTLSARASIADTLVFQISSTHLANRIFDVEIAGVIKLAVLMGMLPLSLARSWELLGDGSVDVRGKITVEQLKSVQVGSLELKLGDFSINRTFGHHAAG